VAYVIAPEIFQVGVASGRGRGSRQKVMTGGGREAQGGVGGDMDKVGEEVGQGGQGSRWRSKRRNWRSGEGVLRAVVTASTDVLCIILLSLSGLLFC
jgi:hypothetical protein